MSTYNPLEIIKYKNRKLFIPKLGYVTLKDLENYIKRDIQFKVTDYDTKSDVTGQVLGQLVASKDNLTIDKIKGLL